MSRRIDTVTGGPKVSAFWTLAATLAAWAAMGTAAYFAGKLLRAVLT